MAKKKKEKGNWVDKLKKGVKYHLSGEKAKDEAKQTIREQRLHTIKSKVAIAKGTAASTKKAKKKKATSRTKQVEAGLKGAGIKKKKVKKMRGNY